jgi:Kef-type K+ transport system membrane component KefB
MKTDIIPLIVGIIIFLSSLISLRVGLSVAIIESIAGIIAGNLGLRPEEWMMTLASFGGIILTFLAGAEVDIDLMKNKFKESFLIGFFSFLLPFIGGFLFSFYVFGWSLPASLITGIASSSTSIAVVYSVLLETGLIKTEIGKLLMASTFITNMGTAIALSVIFSKPTIYTIAFIIASIILIFFATKFSHLVFHNPKLKNKVIEPEIKYIFALLLAFMYFANLGEGHAILPAFLLGLFMSKHFSETSETKVLRNRLRTVSYAVFTPVFFIVSGLRVSMPMIYAALGIFLILLGLKLSLKFLGVYFFAKKFIPHGSIYTTLLMSTGLTFGTIASVFGYNSGYIDQLQYSVLIGIVIGSGIIPAFIAQKWFMPMHDEDIVDVDNE